MDENHHYDLALKKDNDTYRIMLKLNIGDVKYSKASVPVSHNEAEFIIRSSALNYDFYYIESGKEIKLGSAQTKYLSSEVAGGFTGVVIGLYSQNGKEFNEFKDFECRYK